MEMIEWLHNQAIEKGVSYIISKDGYVIIQDEDTLKLGEMMFELVKQKTLSNKGDAQK